MEASDQFGPKGMVGSICVGDHLLYAKTLAVGLMVSGKKIV